MHLSIEDEIVLLRAQVDYLMERLADQPQLTERPINWAALDTQEAAEQWSLLVEWVDALRDRYQLHERVPACWYAHPAQLEELAALRSAWGAAYQSPDARLEDPTQWHDLLERTLSRITAWDRSGCADGTHRPEHVLPDDTDHSHRERTIHADLATRKP